MSATLPIHVLHVHEVTLEDDPIDPSWILEGTPRARATSWVRSKDGTASSFVWDCTAGRFNWYFAEDETIHVVEGSVIVSAEGVDPVTLVAGDAALFRAGTWAVWQVDDYVRKHAILRPHLPRPVVTLHRAWRKSAHLARKVRRSRS